MLTALGMKQEKGWSSRESLWSGRRAWSWMCLRTGNQMFQETRDKQRRRRRAARAQSSRLRNQRWAWSDSFCQQHDCLLQRNWWHLYNNCCVICIFPFSDAYHITFFWVCLVIKHMEILFSWTCLNFIHSLNIMWSKWVSVGVVSVPVMPVFAR